MKNNLNQENNPLIHEHNDSTLKELKQLIEKLKDFDDTSSLGYSLESRISEFLKNEPGALEKCCIWRECIREIQIAVNMLVPYQMAAFCVEGSDNIPKVEMEQFAEIKKALESVWMMYRKLKALLEEESCQKQ